jgi:uncharacterized protein (TIGR00369 family)
MAMRTRTVSWEDPEEAGKKIFGMPGLEAVQAMFRGEVPIPPMGELLGFESVEAEEGRAVLAVEPAEFHSNTAGITHGGLAAALIDAAITTAVLTTLPGETVHRTIDLAIHFIQPLHIGRGKYFAEGTVIHRGRTAATATGVITDADGKLCVHATGTCLIKKIDLTPPDSR